MSIPPASPLPREPFFGPHLTKEQRARVNRLWEQGKVESSTVNEQGPSLNSDLEEVRAAHKIVVEAPAAEEPFTVESFIDGYLELRKKAEKGEGGDLGDRDENAEKEYDSLLEKLISGLVSFVHMNHKLFASKEEQINSKAFRLASTLDRDLSVSLLKGLVREDQAITSPQDEAVKVNSRTQAILGISSLAAALVSANAKHEDYLYANLYKNLGTLIEKKALADNLGCLLRPVERKAPKGGAEVRPIKEAVQMSLPFSLKPRESKQLSLESSAKKEQKSPKDFSIDEIKQLFQETIATLPKRDKLVHEDSLIFNLESLSYIFDFVGKSLVMDCDSKDENVKKENKAKAQEKIKTAKFLRELAEKLPHNMSFKITTDPKDASRSIPYLTSQILDSSRRLSSHLEKNDKSSDDFNKAKKFYSVFLPWIKLHTINLSKAVFKMEILNPMEFAVPRRNSEGRLEYGLPDYLLD